MNKWLLSTALALSLALPAAAQVTPDPNAKPGGSIVITYKDDVATLDPAIGYDWQNWSMIKSLFDGLAQVRGVPIMTVSAATGKGLDDLIRVAFETRSTWSKRVSTGVLNRWFESALEANPPPAPGGKRIKLRYITQAKTRPPGFILFGTRLDDLPESYRRYLVNGIRKELGFGAVPVRLTLRSAKNPFGK